MSDKEEIAVIQNMIGSRLVAKMTPKSIASALWETGYRLDPYPNGKSKGELLAIIDDLDKKLARARFILYTRFGGVPEVDAFLAETNPIKSFGLPGGEGKG